MKKIGEIDIRHAADLERIFGCKLSRQQNRKHEALLSASEIYSFEED